jgi:heme O synthase-like polyprenyltransferase
MLRDDDDQIAWAAFRYSIVYLTGLFFFFFLDHYWNGILNFVTGA